MIETLEGGMYLTFFFLWKKSSTMHYSLRSLQLAKLPEIFHEHGSPLVGNVNRSGSHLHEQVRHVLCSVYELRGVARLLPYRGREGKHGVRILTSHARGFDEERR
jgi:hypothetical protein